MKQFKNERTLVLIKPDGIQRSLIGEVIGRFERIGLKLTAVKMAVPTKELVEKHYTTDPEWFMKTGTKTIQGYRDKGLTPPSEDPIAISKAVLEALKRYLVAGPVIAMVWEGAHAVAIVRKIAGKTEPLTSDIGTIRGDFMLDSYEMADDSKRAVRNLVHVSGSPKEAEDEIKLWFADSEIISYNIVQEKILYDVNLDDILE